MIARHRLVAASFDAIAAGHSDPAGLSVLRDSQLSKHLLMLRMIVDEVEEKPGRQAARTVGTSTVAAGLELLTEAHRHDPAVATGVLAYPYVGAWLVQCLRELRQPQGRPPLTHLAEIAAAAAIRPSLEFDLDVWPADGTVSLPSIGLCLPRTDISPLPVRRNANRTTVGDVDIPADPFLDRVSWYGLQRLADPTAVPIHVVLDDLDPYRAPTAMHATSRLPRSRYTGWRALFAATWRLLCHDHDVWAAQLAELLVALTPLVEQVPGHGMSATARQSFGAIAITCPVEPLGFAAALCHELQHAKLNALQDLVELCEPTDERLYYAPWRSDPRPLTALLHGTYAFLGVADFWQRRSTIDNDARARYEFARVRLQVRQALEVLQTAAGFTTAGRRFVSGMATWADRLLAGQLPEHQHRYAELASDDHYVMWRIRNLRPDPAAVQAVADAWRAGRSAPALPDPRLVPQPEQFMQSSRARLLAAVAADRSAQHLTTHAPSITSSAQPAPVHDGDVHLADGRYGQAAASYRRALSDDAASMAAWSGLSLARQRIADAAEATIWRTHPELVHALYHALATDSGEPPSPEKLARWLAAAR
ncbi:MAG: HEXXH motif domain-containing protein [Actinomycetota bacterium]|nr:HEXXH motif domain-containing protein [Actinomycetota bacterium]